MYNYYVCTICEPNINFGPDQIAALAHHAQVHAIVESNKKLQDSIDRNSEIYQRLFNLLEKLSH